MAQRTQQASNGVMGPVQTFVAKAEAITTALVLRKVNVVTATDVANTALVELGVEPIQSLTENTSRARKLYSVWHIFRRKFLAMHSWNAAKLSVNLAAETESPAVSRWTYKYRLPHDNLRVLTINGEANRPGQVLWELETETDDLTKYLFTNAGAPVELQYVRDVQDVGALGPETVFVMGLAFAAHAASLFSRTAAEKKLLIDNAEKELRIARSHDAMQSAPYQQVDTQLLDSRRGIYGPGVGRNPSTWDHG